MAFTYNPATTEGQVRLMISDTVDAGHIFEDAEVTAALTMSGGSVNSAAAILLRAIAVDMAKLSKRIKALDIEVDRKGASKDLLELAAALEKSEDAGGFAVASRVGNFFGRREFFRKDAERNG